MATQKTSDDMPYGTLYVPMNDVSEKRKSLLMSLKDSLVMQEEFEKIIEIRQQKAEILKQIKKGVESLNSDYQKIRRTFPNVKNVLSNTEKEIDELETQISSLKTNIRSDQEAIDMLNAMESKASGKKPTKARTTSTKKKAPAKKVSKIDRVKNNLKVIEEKLDKL